MSEVDRRKRRLHRKEARVEDIKKQRAAYSARKRNKTIVNIVIALLALIAMGYGVSSIMGGDDTGEYDSFAQCLTDKGVIMYGTDWCPHCQAQKRAFGNSFRYVNYINCDANKAACDVAGVEGYPTWEFPEGPSVSGEQSLETLAERSGCVLA